jgi:hypothetical protein
VLDVMRLCRQWVNQACTGFEVENRAQGRESYGRKLVTGCSGGVLGLLDAVLDRHSLDDLGEVV